MTPDCGCRHPAGGVHRRAFLADLGMGFTGLVLGALLHEDGIARGSTARPWAPPDGKPHFPPKAKSVIWLFMNGGVSHLESFDPKPMLTRYAGKTIAETPFRDVQDPEKLKLARVVVVNDANGQQRNRLLATQVGFKKRGHSGDPRQVNGAEVGGCRPVEQEQEAEHDQVAGQGDAEAGWDSQRRRHAAEACFAVKIHVLAGVQDVKAGHPEQHSPTQH